MLNRILKLSFAGAIAAMMVTITPAQALTLNCPGSNNGENLVATLDAALQGFCGTGMNDDGASGYFSANPTVFGVSGWTKSDKDIDSAPTGAVSFTQAVGVGTNSGTWNIDTFAGLTNIAIALKAGNSFGLFLLDTTATASLSGTWSTDKALSHATIWVQGGGGGVGNPPTVPVPASLPLLIGGIALAGYAGSRRRR